MAQLLNRMGQVRTDNRQAKLDRKRLIARAVMAGCPALISITLAYFPDLQERAAIKEFDGNMVRLDAELSTLLDEITTPKGTDMKHSKRTIAGAQATKSQRQHRKLREAHTEALEAERLSEAHKRLDAPVWDEATVQAMTERNVIVHSPVDSPEFRDAVFAVMDSKTPDQAAKALEASREMLEICHTHGTTENAESIKAMIGHMEAYLGAGQ